VGVSLVGIEILNSDTIPVACDKAVASKSGITNLGSESITYTEEIAWETTEE